MLCNEPQVSGALGTPVLGKLLVKQDTQNTGCAPHGLDHLAAMCPSACHGQVDQCKGKNMVFVLGGVLLSGCVVARAGVPPRRSLVCSRGGLLAPWFCSCLSGTHRRGRRARHAAPLGSAPHSLPRLAAADALRLLAGVHHLPVVWCVSGSGFALLAHHH